MEILSSIITVVFVGYIVTAISYLFLNPGKLYSIKIKAGACELLLAAAVLSAASFIINTIEVIIEAQSSQEPYAQFAFLNRMFGPYWWAYWLPLIWLGIIPQILWFKRSKLSMVIVALSLSIGVFLERIIILITSLHRNYMPSGWVYKTTMLWGILISILLYSILLLSYIIVKEKVIASIRKNV